MKRLLRHFIGGRDFTSYLLLLISLWTVAYGLSKSVLSVNFTMMSILAFIGLSFSWLCSVTRLKDWHVTLLTIFMCIAGSIYYFANLFKPLLALVNAVRSAVVGVLTGSASGSVDNSSINYALQQMNAQLGSFFTRLMLWGDQLRAGQVGHDKLIISMAWDLVFWLVVVWAGWLLFRHHAAIVSILPATTLLAGTLNYVAANPLHLVPLIATTLIIKARTTYGQQEQYWLKHKIDYAEDIRFDLNMLVPALAVVFMLISLFAPSFSIRQIIKTSQIVTEHYQGRLDSIAKSLGLQPQSKARNSFSSLSNPGLPRSHLLGSGPELLKDVVMVVGTGDYLPAQSLDALPGEPTQYYWRSLTYDIYTGHGWETSSIDVSSYSTNQPAIEGFYPITGTLHLVHQSVRFTQDLGSLVYSTGQLISVDKEYQVAWRKPPTGNSDGSQEQIADEFGATVEGNEYMADSFINTISLTRLRSAAGDIPSWILDRYLALPESLPDRVRQLATDLTVDQHTKYDQAAAIETYLRTFTYTLDLPSPPPDRDVVDYFLFDLKRGYCDYYASAMVVMARSIGIPARLVTGYSSGIYDPVNAYYVVTQANAHSWVEVYLSGIGWVEFEPTTSLPAIQHSSDQTDVSAIPQIKPVQPFSLQVWLSSIQSKWWVILGGIFGALFLGVIFWIMGDTWRLHRLSPSMAIVQLYQRFHRKGQPLAEGLLTGDTPLEFTSRVNQKLSLLATPHRWKSYFRRGVGETGQLTRLYSLVMYSPHAPLRTDQLSAIQTWVHLRIRLWLAVKLGILKRSTSRKNRKINR